MNYACSVPRALTSKYRWENFCRQYLDFPTDRVCDLILFCLYKCGQAQFVLISKSAIFFLSTRRIISYSANSSFDVLTFFLVMQTSKIVLECFSAFVKSAENLFGCDLIENIFVHFCYSTKCFLSVSFLYAEGNDLFGVITCWPLGLFWTYCSASQGPCSFVPHSLVTETKTSAQELSWRNVDNWEKQFYPTKFSHKDG